MTNYEHTVQAIHGQNGNRSVIATVNDGRDGQSHLFRILFSQSPSLSCTKQPLSAGCLCQLNESQEKKCSKQTLVGSPKNKLKGSVSKPDMDANEADAHQWRD